MDHLIPEQADENSIAENTRYQRLASVLDFWLALARATGPTL